jgi:hypothetical protein
MPDDHFPRQRRPPLIRGDIRSWLLASPDHLTGVRAELQCLLHSRPRTAAVDTSAPCCLGAFDDLAEAALPRGAQRPRITVVLVDGRVFIDVTREVDDGGPPPPADLARKSTTRRSPPTREVLCGWYDDAGRRHAWTLCCCATGS